MFTARYELDLLSQFLLILVFTWSNLTRSRIYVYVLFIESVSILSLTKDRRWTGSRNCENSEGAEFSLAVFLLCLLYLLLKWLMKFFVAHIQKYNSIPYWLSVMERLGSCFVRQIRPAVCVTITRITAFQSERCVVSKWHEGSVTFYAFFWLSVSVNTSVSFVDFSSRHFGIKKLSIRRIMVHLNNFHLSNIN